jgi:hypothetical protein
MRYRQIDRSLKSWRFRTTRRRWCGQTGGSAFARCASSTINSAFCRAEQMVFILFRAMLVILSGMCSDMNSWNSNNVLSKIANAVFEWTQKVNTRWLASDRDSPTDSWLPPRFVDCVMFEHGRRTVLVVKWTSSSVWTKVKRTDMSQRCP